MPSSIHARASGEFTEQTRSGTVPDNVGVLDGDLQGTFSIATLDLGGNIRAQKVALVRFLTPAGDSMVNDDLNALGVVLSVLESDQDSISVTGLVAHGSTDDELRPILIGVRASLNEPADVADGQLAETWGDRKGRPVVLIGHANPETPVSVNATASGDTTVIAAPGAGLSLHICKGSLINGGAAAIVAGLQESGSATSVWAGEWGSDGGGALFDFGARCRKLTANTALQVNLPGTGNVRVNVTEYYIAAA